LAIHVVLVQPEIHWNTGNAGRSCLAAGATLHLIQPLGFSLDEREVKRAGLDYWEHVDRRVWPSWEAFEAELPTLGDPYFFSTKAARLLWDAPLGAPMNVVLVFGRARAVAQPFHERGDRPVRGASATASGRAINPLCLGGPSEPRSSPFSRSLRFRRVPPNGAISPIRCFRGYPIILSLMPESRRSSVARDVR